MGNGVSVASGAEGAKPLSVEWYRNEVFSGVDVDEGLKAEIQLYISAGDSSLDILEEALKDDTSKANMKLDGGNNFLHLAAEAGNVGACRILLNYGTIEMINDENEDGYTPLTLAIIRSNQDVFNLFLQQVPTLAEGLSKIVADEEAGSMVKTNLEAMLKSYDDTMREEVLTPVEASVADVSTEEVVVAGEALSPSSTSSDAV